MKVSGQPHALAAQPLAKEPRYTLNRLGGPESWCWSCGGGKPLQGIQVVFGNFYGDFFFIDIHLCKSTSSLFTLQFPIRPPEQ